MKTFLLLHFIIAFNFMYFIYYYVTLIDLKVKTPMSIMYKVITSKTVCLLCILYCNVIFIQCSHVYLILVDKDSYT